MRAANSAPRPGPWGHLETARLVLRPLTTDDADALVELHADPRVHGFVSRFTRERAVERLASNERDWAERGYGLYGVTLKSTGRFIGRCGLKYWPQFDEVEAGWVLRPDAWGHGYATEAARACIDWGFTHLAVRYITAMIAPANTASIRVAERLGFAPDRPETLAGSEVIVHVLDRSGRPKQQGRFAG